MKNKIFVSGATGFQGNPIAQLLIAKGEEVVTISPTKEKNEIGENIKIYAGGFDNLTSLNNALTGVNKAVFALPLVFDIEKAKEYTRNFIAAAEKANVSLIVFNTSFDLPKEKTGLLALDLKVEVDTLFKTSNLNVITLMPDVYIDNLTAPWSIPLITGQGILPYPVKNGQKIPWISHFDLARFVVSALNKTELIGKTLPIGGNLLTGEEISAAISDKVGKPVQFIGITPDDFEKNLAPNFGDLAAKEISNLYRYVDNTIVALTNKDFSKTQELLEVKPTSVHDWVESVKWN